MPRLARHKSTLDWYNDFIRTERPAGSVLAAIQKAGLDSSLYEEVVVTDAAYETYEAAFFAAGRAALAVVEAQEAADWASAKVKLEQQATAQGLTADELQQYRKHVLGS